MKRLFLIVATAIGCAIFANPAAAGTGTTTLWIGDSYTFGAGVTQPWVYGEARLVSSALGWSPIIDAEGGTGFVNPGPAAHGYTSVPNRLASYAGMSPAPDVVVVDAGRNDYAVPAAEEIAVVTGYLLRLRRAFPNSAVVIIAPWTMRSRWYDYLELRCLLAEQARSYGWKYVDPIGRGWVGLTTAKLMGPGTGHPNEAGYEYIAEHLAPEIRKALEASRQGVPRVCLEQWSRIRALVP